MEGGEEEEASDRAQNHHAKPAETAGTGATHLAPPAGLEPAVAATTDFLVLSFFCGNESAGDWGRATGDGVRVAENGKWMIGRWSGFGEVECG